MCLILSQSNDQRFNKGKKYEKVLLKLERLGMINVKKVNGKIKS